MLKQFQMSISVIKREGKNKNSSGAAKVKPMKGLEQRKKRGEGKTK